MTSESLKRPRRVLSLSGGGGPRKKNRETAKGDFVPGGVVLKKEKKEGL